MKRAAIIIFVFINTILLKAQSNSPAYTRVYEIMQLRCVSCHSGSTPSGGLDLQGTGNTLVEKQNAVFTNLVNAAPSNAGAVAKRHKRVYPGRADKSFLFLKIHNGLEPIYTLSANEGAMHDGTTTAITSSEKEMIRQWILFGANKTTIVPEDRIRAFYDTVGRGLPAFETPPPAPAPSEGFQIKMGPFFLSPLGKSGDEVEYFQKWELEMANDVEVNRIDHIISNSSHHLIIYNFNSLNDANKVGHGLRLNAYHNNINLVSAVQEKTDLRLPARTGFKWEKNRILDLNSHYINYSANHVYKAEAYINVYTQPVGTARQLMNSILIPNTNINIPNNNQTITAEQPFSLSSGRVYLWTLMGHTHKYGTGYKIFKRLSNGQKGELMYDGACPNGIPGCASPYFDYQHIPMRYFAPFKTMDLNPGLIHQATWKNSGDKTLTFGPTSDDEMMVMIAMYTLDTVGLSSNRDILKPLAGVVVAPNPVYDFIQVQLPPSVAQATFTLYDLVGRVVRRKDVMGQQIQIETGDLQSGLYLYYIEDALKRVTTGKLMLVKQ